MKQRLFLLSLGLFLGIGGATFWLLTQNLNSESIEFGRQLKKPRPVAEFRLLNQKEKPFTKANLLDKWTMITFGFTNCPDVCPTALASFRDELKLLTEENQKVQFVFVSVDPERDTPASLEKYIDYFHPEIMGLTGEVEEISKLSKSFGVYFAKDGEGENYNMNHSPQFFLVDPEGNFAAMYTPPLARGKIAMDLSRVVERTTL